MGGGEPSPRFYSTKLISNPFKMSPKKVMSLFGFIRLIEQNHYFQNQLLHLILASHFVVFLIDFHYEKHGFLYFIIKILAGV